MNLYPRHRLDLELHHLAFAAGACAGAKETPTLEWKSALICQSARSGLDLALTALALPRGSEVLVTALTIPDMVRVLEDHGLVAVPIDLEPGTLAPRPEAWAAALTPRTRAVLFAHLFGARLDVAPLAALAKQHPLVLIEDLAQGFIGSHDHGSDDADITLFSFGLIKTATALGGALVYVRGPKTRAAMAELQAAWPEQPVAEYARRVARTAALHTGSRDARAYGALAKAVSLSGRELDAVVHSMTRGFPADTMLSRIRRRPCGALVAMLRHRLEHFEPTRLLQRAEAGEALRAALGARVVGRDQLARTHWLFAVTSEDPAALIRHLYAQGFDATRGATSLTAVAAPAGRPEATQVRRLLEQIVFVPAWPEIPVAERERLISELASAGA